MTLKDLDLKHELALPPWMLTKFQKQVNDDCGWLRSLGIMDYSLLMLVRALCVNCACTVRALPRANPNPSPNPKPDLTQMHFKGQADRETDADYEDSDSHRDGYGSNGYGSGHGQRSGLANETRSGSAVRFGQTSSNVEEVPYIYITSRSCRAVCDERVPP